MTSFPCLQEVADSWNLFGKVFRKLLTGARDEREGAIVMEESGEEGRKRETKRKREMNKSRVIAMC